MTGKPLIHAFFDEPTNTVSYIVADPATKEAAFIDPVQLKAGFYWRCRREIDRQDVQALLCKPHAVASLAVGDRKHLAAVWQQVRLRAQELIWLGPEHEIGCREARLPACKLVHVVGSARQLPPTQ